MIDTDTYRRIHQSNRSRGFGPPTGSPRPKNHDSWPIEVQATEAVDDSILMILPPFIPGFEMQAKNWGTFGFGVSIICTAKRIKVRLNIEQIEPVVWNKIAFERLVLEQKSKELIKALVTVHVSAKKMGDIISGKGNGLIILLHGSPGVGKTLTAGNLSSKAQNIFFQF